MVSPGPIENSIKKWGANSPESSPRSLMSTMSSKQLLVGGSLTSAAWIIRMLQEKRRSKITYQAGFPLFTPHTQPVESESRSTTKSEISQDWLSFLGLHTPESS